MARKSRYLVVLLIVLLILFFLFSETTFGLTVPLLFGLTTKAKKFQVLDVYLAAWLSMKGHPPDFIRQGTRVIFEFPASDEVYRIAAQYNGNPDVALLDFVSEVRKVRSRMLSARG
jgi:hypothetical protein